MFAEPRSFKCVTGKTVTVPTWRPPNFVPITLEETFAKLNPAIDEIMAVAGKVPDHSVRPQLDHAWVSELKSIMFRASYCNLAPKLYDHFGEVVSSYLETVYVPALNPASDDEHLMGMLWTWTNFQMLLTWLQAIYHCIDGIYAHVYYKDKLNRKASLLYVEKVFLPHYARASKGMLARFEVARLNGVRPDDLSRFQIMYSDMVEFLPDKFDCNILFQNTFLKETREYYNRAANEWLNEGTLYYVDKSREVFRIESDMDIVHVLEEELYEKRLSTLVRGLYVMMEQDQMEAITSVYSVLNKKHEWLIAMADQFQSFIVKIGTSILQTRTCNMEKENNDDVVFIETLMKHYNACVTMSITWFDQNPIFMTSIDKCFGNLMNTNIGTVSMAEMLASFCDKGLRSSDKKSYDEMNMMLSTTSKLFSYLIDKDIFAECYRDQFAKRLLSTRSSHEYEKQMISMMKLQCGSAFTSKFEGMMNDVVNQEQYATAGFQPTILSIGNWPSSVLVNVILPPSMERSIREFNRLYIEQHAMRRLQWRHGWGDAEVRGYWNGKHYDLQVSSLQAIVLMSIPCNSEWMTLDYLCKKMNLTEDVMKRLLHSLSCGKHKVMLKSTPSNSIKTTDEFKVNASFSSKTLKLRIPMPSLIDVKNTMIKVEEDRSFLIDAALVRIMKARKKLNHNDLLAEVHSQLTFFSADPRQIKKRIESLLDREYLERSEDDQTSYTVNQIPSCYPYSPLIFNLVQYLA
jgi:cullin 1